MHEKTGRIARLKNGYLMKGFDAYNQIFFLEVSVVILICRELFYLFCHTPLTAFSEFFKKIKIIPERQKRSNIGMKKQKHRNEKQTRQKRLEWMY